MELGKLISDYLIKNWAVCVVYFTVLSIYTVDPRLTELEDSLLYPHESTN